MKSFFLGMLLFIAVAIPAFTHVSYSPEQEILGISFMDEAYAQNPAVVAPKVAEAILPDEDVKPYFEVVQSVIKVLNKSFPNVGPVIQAATEIIGGLASFFTLLSVFLLGVLRLPAVIARFSGAHDLASKIEKISVAIQYWVQKLSIFNVQKKK